ncbi:MAG: uracil-DNA glycosylase family protein, partial [Pseudomonadota bacterium]
RAMLEEMGIKVWWPTAAVAAVAVDAESPESIESPESPESHESAGAVAQQANGFAVRARADAPASRVAPSAAARPAATAAPTTAPPPARRADATPSIGAGVLVDAPRRLYASDEADATNATQGGWLIVADMPPDVDGRHGEPFAGDAGRLLDNMLRALQLHAGALPVHLVRTHRGVASGRGDSPQPFVDAFQAQAEALAPRVVLAMGPLAAQSLLQRGEPLGKLRGQVGEATVLNGTPVVATYHPAYLLRTPADKARAWADLCLAADAAAQAVPGTV